MRAKKIIVKDVMTVMPVIVLQFDETDQEFCDQSGSGTGLRIILKIYGQRVSCVAGYKFAGKRGKTLEGMAVPFDSDGTISSFAEMLDQVQNIQHLPDEINVEDTRMALIDLRHRPLVKDIITDELDNFTDHSKLRKLIYKNWLGHHGTALIDIEFGNLVTYYSTSRDWKEQVAEYLWIPLQAATEEQAEPFKEELEFKELLF